MRWDRGPGAPNQAILLDLDGRRGWIFDIVIWPQEVYFVTGFLILAAIGLFLATSLFGRVWCGFACPQTVWTDLFMLVERLIEGDRNERLRIDRMPMSFAKALRNAADVYFSRSRLFLLGAMFSTCLNEKTTRCFRLASGVGLANFSSLRHSWDFKKHRVDIVSVNLTWVGITFQLLLIVHCAALFLPPDGQKQTSRWRWCESDYRAV